MSSDARIAHFARCRCLFDEPNDKTTQNQRVDVATNQQEGITDRRAERAHEEDALPRNVEFG